MSEIPEGALRWITSSDTGLSSKAIFTHMTGGTEFRYGRADYPHDPADFGRCARLLEAVPEWRARLPEMARHGREWAALVKEWDAIEASMRAEVGLRWERGRRAAATYALMQSIIESKEKVA